MIRSRVFSTLQLALSSSVLVQAGAFYSITQRENYKEPQEEFGQNSASLVQQGQCRAYLALGHSTESTSTCENKCGDVAKKAEETGNVTSVGCMGLQRTPTYTDPKGDDYRIGRCLCDPFLVDIIFHEVLIALPAIAVFNTSLDGFAFKVLAIALLRRFALYFVRIILKKPPILLCVGPRGPTQLLARSRCPTFRAQR